jgi:hypothetical protein
MTESGRSLFGLLVFIGRKFELKPVTKSGRFCERGKITDYLKNKPTGRKRDKSACLHQSADSLPPRRKVGYSFSYWLGIQGVT